MRTALVFLIMVTFIILITFGWYLAVLFGGTFLGAWLLMRFTIFRKVHA